MNRPSGGLALPPDIIQQQQYAEALQQEVSRQPNKAQTFRLNAIAMLMGTMTSEHNHLGIKSVDELLKAAEKLDKFIDRG